MQKLIIFDLDGVLFESRDMHFTTLNRALMVHGYPPISTEDHHKQYNGLPSFKKLQMLGIAGETAEKILADKQFYTRLWLTDNVHPDPSLIRLFAELEEKKYRIGVVSNAVTETVYAALTALGLRDKVFFRVSPGLTLRPKPAPDMFFNCIATADSTPAETIIVEDSEVGLEAAGQSGAAVLRVDGPHQVVAKVRKACNL
jgi:HAD superfamily hydrolase (TIGR01509 family)